MNLFSVNFRYISSALIIILYCVSEKVVADDNIQFNTDVLDIKDRSNFDLERFSRAGYIVPGNYRMSLRINSRDLPEQEVIFFAPEDDQNASVPCITPEMAEKFSLKKQNITELLWNKTGQCLDMNSLSGMSAVGDVSKNIVQINIPQIYLEYSAQNWDPPASWDHGVSSVIMDYSFNGMRSNSRSSTYESLDGNGVLGVNYDAWRFSADWQSSINRDKNIGTNSRARITRYYAYRPLPTLAAKLTVGENYLSSMIFDSFRYLGGAISSEDNMLPPNLRGYAPEIIGVAKTNAKVTVSQQGRILYETTVPSGPFKLDDLSSSISGTLDIAIQEQDGSVMKYQMTTASIPYLSRPGSVRYSMSTGQSTGYIQNQKGTNFASGEFSWGVNNGLSLYGGGIFGKDYNALAIGAGFDLLRLGAISFDVTRSAAKLPQQETLSGNSYKLSYSKNFDEYKSQVTFAGYRYSDKNFMNMSQYLSQLNSDHTMRNSKEQRTVSFNKRFDSGLSAYINYSRQVYWDRGPANNYSLSLSDTFKVAGIKSINVNLTAYKNLYNNTSDKGLFLSVSLPLGRGQSMNLGYDASNSRSNNTIGYGSQIDDKSSYRVSAGTGSNRPVSGNAYYQYAGDIGDYSANTSFQGGTYNSIGISARGGVTLTGEGAAMHRTSSQGGARVMVGADGIEDVPVRGYSGITRTNSFGNAVVADVNSYYRSSISIDLNKLPDNVEASAAVHQMTLTEGAVGYRKLNVISGYKAMAVFKREDGEFPPFGATVVNAENRQLGMAGEAGVVYLTGINIGEEVSVSWGGGERCVAIIPKDANLKDELNMNFSLECKMAVLKDIQSE